MHIQLLPVSEWLLLLLLLVWEQGMLSQFRPDFLQSQNLGILNSCHFLLQEPTYAALTAPASSGNCRNPDSLGWGLNPLIAVQLSGTTTTTQIGWQHTFPKNQRYKFWQAWSNQQAGSTLESVFHLFFYGGSIISHQFSHQEAGRERFLLFCLIEK